MTVILSLVILFTVTLARIVGGAPTEALASAHCCTNKSSREERRVCEALQLRESIHDSLADVLRQTDDHNLVARVVSCLEKREHGAKAPRLHFHDSKCCEIMDYDAGLSEERLARCQRACHGAFITPRLPWQAKIAEFAACMGETSTAFSRHFARCVKHSNKHSDKYWHAVGGKLFDDEALVDHHESDIEEFV